MKVFFIFSIVLIFSKNVLSQELPKLKISNSGVEYIVIKADSLTSQILYDKTLNWIKVYYKNPDKVLQSNITNEKIRISAFKENAWWYFPMGIKTSYHMDYNIEISFKDGKYKIDFYIGQFYTTDYAKTLFSYSSFFKSNGDVKNIYSDAIISIEETMNSIILNHFNYINGKIENDNW